ncbi:zinc ion binding [Branchiostoma belcheri]|nr:zinc ion binding [Branchiostoma belcheri]
MDPVDQQDSQPHWVPTGPEERQDTPPRYVKDPLQGVHCDASAEHTDQNDGHGYSPDNVAERTLLQTFCTSYTNIGKTKQSQACTHVDRVIQNQALYADNSQVDAGDPTSTDIYDTKGHNANNVGQYQLRDTFVTEASSTAYQCGGEVDDASVDNGRNTEADDFDQSVSKQLKDAESPDENKSEEGVTADDSSIRPHAVAYQQDGKPNGEEDDIIDIQPYAVVYDEQPLPGHSVDNSQSACGQPNTSPESADGKKDGLLPNPMYSGNVLHQNPMYAPNVAQPRADRDHRCVCLACAITLGVVVVTLVLVAIFMPRKEDSNTQTTWTDPTMTYINTDGVTQNMDYTLLPEIKEKENKELKQTTIVFGRNGEESTECFGLKSVAVSPGNEIFIADTYNRQVQVFSMKGVSLRRFPTVTSGENFETLEPKDISIDGEGHVWILGATEYTSGFIVRYTKRGSHLTTLSATFSNNSFSAMTVDTLRNLVVATEHWWDYGEVKLLHFNGTVVGRFQVQQFLGDPPRVVAVGREGNLFVADSYADARVNVYNNTGQYLFSFGDDNIAEGQAEMGEGQTDMGLGLAEMGEGQTEMGLGLAEMGEGQTEMGLGLAEIGLGLAEMGEGQTEMGLGLAEMGEGQTEMGLGLAKMGEGQTEMGLGLAEIGLGLEEMGEGQTEMGLGLKEMGEGQTEMGLGLAEMGEGQTELGLGLEEMEEGQTEMGLGLEEMGEGQTDMGLGMAKMGEGRTDMGLEEVKFEDLTEADENEAVMGICTDGSGNVLLVRIGGAVDMFTEDGRYVRRVITSRAGGVVVAPGGQLVVTDVYSSNVTILSHYLEDP